MSDVVHLLWFTKDMPEGEDDIELLLAFTRLMRRRWRPLSE